MRNGAETRLIARPDREPAEPGHTLVPVYVEMLLQVCRDYPGLPDPRTLRLTEIRFFYRALVAELKKSTGPKTPPTPHKPRRRR